MDSLMLHRSLHLWMYPCFISFFHLFKRYFSIFEVFIYPTSIRSGFFFLPHPTGSPREQLWFAPGGLPAPLRPRQSGRSRLGPAAPRGQRQRKVRGAALRSGGAGAAAQLQEGGGRAGENCWSAGGVKHGEISMC